MGMGDKPQPFTPTYTPIRCDVTGHMFSPCAVRRCPEPHVIDKYGLGGEAHVSVWVCKTCRYGEKDKYCDAYGCKYGLEERVQA